VALLPAKDYLRALLALLNLAGIVAGVMCWRQNENYPVMDSDGYLFIFSPGT
jgi:hypothetical protein